MQYFVGYQSDKVEVKNCKFGRGIFAKELIQAGEVLSICPTIAFPADENAIIAATKLAQYTFQGRGTIFLALGISSLFNHSSRANAYAMFEHSLTTDLTIKTNYTIKKGAQIFINYAYSLKTNDKTYQKAKELLLQKM